MATIAELMIKVDSSQVESATQKLQKLTQATTTATKAEDAASKSKQDSANDTSKLLSQIDRQTKSLSQLAVQQKLLNAARSEDAIDASQFEHYNAIIEQNIRLARERGTVIDSEAQKEGKLMSQAIAEDRKRTEQKIADAEKAAQAEGKWQTAALAEDKKRTDAQIAAIAKVDQAESDRYDAWNSLAAKRTQEEAREEAQRQAIRNDAQKKGEAMFLSQQKALVAEQERIDKILYTNKLRRWSEEEKANNKAAIAALKGQQAIDNETKALNNLLAAIDPVTREMQRLDALQAQLNAQRGKGINDPQFERYSAVIENQRKEIAKYNTELNRTGITAKQVRLAQQGLPAQFTDIFVSLQGGQAPLTVFLQQGGQIKDMFGGTIPAIKGVSAAVMGMVNPWTLAAAAVAAFVLAAKNGEDELQQLQNALILTGNAAGETGEHLNSMAKGLADDGPATVQTYVDAIEKLISSAKVPPELFGTIASSSARMADATGQDMDKILDDFISLGKDPVDAAIKLNEKYGFLTGAVHAQMQALVAQGKEQDAAKLAMETYADVMDERSTKINNNLGILSQSWKSLAGFAKDAWDAMLDVSRTKSAEDRLAEVNAAIEKAQSQGNFQRNGRLSGGIGLKALIAERDALQATIKSQKEAAAAEATRQQQERASISFQEDASKTIQDNLTKVEKAKKSIADFDAKYFKQSKEDQQRNAGTYKTARAALERELKEAEEAAAKKNTPKAVREDAGVARLETIRQQGAALKEQIGTVATLTGAEKALAKFNQEVYDLEHKTVLTIQEKQILASKEKIKAALEENAQLEKKIQHEENILKLKTFQANLDEELAQAGEGYAADVASYGMGSEDAARAQARIRLDQEEARRRRDIQRRYDDKGNKELYDSELAALEEFYEKRRQQQEKAFEDEEAAQADWKNGAIAAMDDYFDAASNVAAGTYTVFSNAFDGMTDTLADFLSTGKADFSDFAVSVLKDINKVILKMMILEGFKAATGATGDDMGSAIMSLFAADGAAFHSGGAQFFANGGAFTNSVVSKPTAFNHAGGLGVMGEAGPEAIMPLTRGAGGELGVRADLSALQGAAGGSGGVLVQVNISGDGQTSSSASEPEYEQFGKDLGNFVDQRYKQLLMKDLMPGGSIWRTTHGGA